MADSSSAANSEINSEIISSVQDSLRIEHQLHDLNTGLFSKIARALEKTDSKYSVVCGDDDFIVPRTVGQCANFLEDNPDYSAAHGLILSMYPSDAAPSISKLWTHRLSQHTIDNADPSQRLPEHLREYEATFYSVYRRTQLIRNMELASKKTTDYRFGELLPSCLSIIQGKLKHLNMLHGIRPYNPDSTASSYPYWDTMLTSDQFSQRYSHFRDCLVDELVLVAGISRAEATNLVNRSFLVYVTKTLQSAYGYDIGPKRSRASRQMHRGWQVAKLLSPMIRSAVVDRRISAMIRTPKELMQAVLIESTSSYMAVEKLLDARSPFRLDFLPIYEHIVRCPQGLWNRQEHVS